MPKCYALTAIGRPCRNYSSKDSYTCLKHSLYFDQFSINDWKHSLKYLEVCPRTKTHIENVMSIGIVQIPKEFVESLANCRNYTYFILLCARWLEGFSYTWNEPLFNTALKKLWLWSSSIGPVVIKHDDILTMIRGNVKELFYKSFILYPHSLEFPYTKEHWSEYVKECAKADWFAPIFHLDTHETKIQECIEFLDKKNLNPILLAFLRDNFPIVYENAKKKYYKKICSYSSPFKEQILEMAWEPSRMSAWCLDEDEKRRVQRW